MKNIFKNQILWALLAFVVSGPLCAMDDDSFEFTSEDDIYETDYELLLQKMVKSGNDKCEIKLKNYLKTLSDQRLSFLTLCAINGSSKELLNAIGLYGNPILKAIINNDIATFEQLVSDKNIVLSVDYVFIAMCLDRQEIFNRLLGSEKNIDMSSYSYGIEKSLVHIVFNQYPEGLDIPMNYIRTFVHYGYLLDFNDCAWAVDDYEIDIFNFLINLVYDTDAQACLVNTMLFDYVVENNNSIDFIHSLLKKDLSGCDLKKYIEIVVMHKMFTAQDNRLQLPTRYLKVVKYIKNLAQFTDNDVLDIFNVYSEKFNRRMALEGLEYDYKFLKRDNLIHFISYYPHYVQALIFHAPYQWINPQDQKMILDKKNNKMCVVSDKQWFEHMLKNGFQRIDEHGIPNRGSMSVCALLTMGNKLTQRLSDKKFSDVLFKTQE